MSGVRKATKILAMPIFKKQWLYAVEETTQDLVQLPSWRQGRSGVEMVKMASAQLLQKGHEKLLDQWEKLSEAEPWSLKGRLYKLARIVIDGEGVTDTFLKTLPAKTDHYQIIYPSNIPERYVRRRTRLFLQQQEYYQRCRQIMWGVLAVPTIPLFVIPLLPNIPMYYAGYKVWCHTRALNGCRKLLATMTSQPSSAATRAALATAAARKLSAEASAGTAANPPSAASLAEVAPPIEAAVDGHTSHTSGQHRTSTGRHTSGSSSGARRHHSGSGPQQTTYDLKPDPRLTEVVEAFQKRSEPVSKEAAIKLGMKLGFPSLGNLLGRALPDATKQT
mmetsp:Transcript_11174/g.33513  ORF Transcript_11174/g.33513 Transcript_11174/m.33513 type:complete len:334 (-) Transcript_11174:431-1432(-)|eukprot:CAMPEP_0206137366 /NCGR_PEP_ID=MMETSP1473-20131121/2503_1 /ASSEMBLY_ACC=CAM_ASM_001109 /TAXON_ID=1461547 /ORGANISM="Stichococcus sp, Strain RCC1054" /LENGTH=333 /DNA_ID=CAMNT_0053530413 /DNA_START=144 /DNA_END=1145 /DNA_ORIENTATION=-